MKINVKALIIDTKYGVDIRAHLTEEDRENGLYDYVYEWWADVAVDGEDIPEDRDEAIQFYFENHTGEWYAYNDTLLDIPDEFIIKKAKALQEEE